MTDERRYRSPAALEQAVKDLLARRFPAEEFHSRRSEIAYRRLVARLYETQPDRWVLKGGFALILRLDPSRTSNDIDVTYVAEVGEHALALEALEEAVDRDLDDFFTFEIVRVGEETEDRARPVTVLSRLGVQEFTRFRVDLSVPQPDVPAERIEAPPLSGVEEIDGLPPVLVLAWPQQIAEKACAIFEQHGDDASSRVRDLADIGMVARQVDGLSADDLIDALRGEEARRRERSLPEGLPPTFALREDHALAWRRNFAKGSRNAPISFDEALELAAAFLDPILDGSASGQTWSAAKTAYI